MLHFVKRAPLPHSLLPTKDTSTTAAVENANIRYCLSPSPPPSAVPSLLFHPKASLFDVKLTKVPVCTKCTYQTSCGRKRYCNDLKFWARKLAIACHIASCVFKEQSSRKRLMDLGISPEGRFISCSLALHEYFATNVSIPFGISVQ